MNNAHCTHRDRHECTCTAVGYADRLREEHATGSHDGATIDECTDCRPRFETVEIDVCSDCAMLHANGETPDCSYSELCDDPRGYCDGECSDKFAAMIDDMWPSAAGWNIYLTCEEDTHVEFSWSPCDSCGSSLGGSRCPAVAMRSAGPVAAQVRAARAAAIARGATRAYRDAVADGAERRATVNIRAAIDWQRSANAVAAEARDMIGAGR